MKIMKVTLIILGILIILIICIYAYYGGFKKISLNVENQGGEIMVYENVIGDYKHTAKYTDKIYYSLLNDKKIGTTKGIGIFYDNPQKIDKDKLRSDVGCIVENSDSITIARLSEEYQVKTLEKKDYVVSKFPFKGGMSIILGIMKVYPALNKYCEENGFKDSPVTEIYDVLNKKIVYRKEVIK